MDRTFEIGVAATVVGVAGYVTGVFVAYPGRAFSLTAVMLGVTCLAVGDPEPGDETGATDTSGAKSPDGASGATGAPGATGGTGSNGGEGA